MVFSAVRAAILRGSQELAPQDDVGDSFTAYFAGTTIDFPQARRPCDSQHHI